MRLRTNAMYRQFMALQSEKIEKSIRDINEFRLNTARYEVEIHCSEQLSRT